MGLRDSAPATMRTLLSCALLLTLSGTMSVDAANTITKTISEPYHHNVTYDGLGSSTHNTTNITTNDMTTNILTTSHTIPTTTTTTTTRATTPTTTTTTTRSTNYIIGGRPTNKLSSAVKSPSVHYRQRLYFPAILPTSLPPSTTSSPPFYDSSPPFSPASFFSFNVPFALTSPMVSVFHNAGVSPSLESAQTSPASFFYRVAPSHTPPPPPPLPVRNPTPSPPTLKSPKVMSVQASRSHNSHSIPISKSHPQFPTHPSFPLSLSHPSLSYPDNEPLWRLPFSPSPGPVRRERTIPSTVPPPPYFDDSTPTNVTTQLGTHAFLSCIVRNLGNQSISWVRSRDAHILTVDRFTFIADQRFQVRYHPDEERWSLQIKFVQARDDGRYECQVSTEPKISRFVHFHVVTPVVHIPGGPDIYVKSGSHVTLKCIISAALHQPQYIFWYQGKERVIAGERGREVWEERPMEGGRRGVEEERTVGTLDIPRASPRDQGDYTCVPDNLPNTTVTLHVLSGEHPAAIYHGSATPHRPLAPLLSLLPLLCWLLGGTRPHQPPLAPRPR